MVVLDFTRFVWGALFLAPFETSFYNVVEKMPLTEFQKMVIKNHFLRTVTKTRQQYIHVLLLYLLLGSCITVGGALLISFLIFDKMSIIQPTKESSQLFFWMSWTTSFLVLLANKLMYSFSIYKNYTNYKDLLKRFESEGWQFISKINKYGQCSNIDEQFSLFCQRIDKIEKKVLKLGSQSKLVGNESLQSSLGSTDTGRIGRENNDPITSTSADSNDMFRDLESGLGENMQLDEGKIQTLINIVRKHQPNFSQE